YDVQPHVVKYDDAVKPGAPKVFPDAQPNTQGNVAAVDSALGTSDAVIEAEYRTKIMHHCCLETHGVVVDYKGGDTATLYVSTQDAFGSMRDAPGELGVQAAKMVTQVQHMGGGFGSKFGMGVTGQ